jgi:hypothetical protein
MLRLLVVQPYTIIGSLDEVCEASASCNKTLKKHQYAHPGLLLAPTLLCLYTRVFPCVDAIDFRCADF